LTCDFNGVLTIAIAGPKYRKIPPVDFLPKTTVTSAELSWKGNQPGQIQPGVGGCSEEISKPRWPQPTLVAKPDSETNNNAEHLTLKSETQNLLLLILVDKCHIQINFNLSEITHHFCSADALIPIQYYSSKHSKKN